MFHQGGWYTICFAKTVERSKKDLVSVIISKEQKKVKTSGKKMEKSNDLHKEEKRRHEEVLQRYQVDHLDKMEIINIHKRCKKRARKVPQLKKASSSPKSDESE